MQSASGSVFNGNGEQALSLWECGGAAGLDQDSQFWFGIPSSAGATWSVHGPPEILWRRSIIWASGSADHVAGGSSYSSLLWLRRSSPWHQAWKSSDQYGNAAGDVDRLWLWRFVEGWPLHELWGLVQNRYDQIWDLIRVHNLFLLWCGWQLLLFLPFFTQEHNNSVLLSGSSTGSILDILLLSGVWVYSCFGWCVDISPSIPKTRLLIRSYSSLLDCLEVRKCRGITFRPVE